MFVPYYYIANLPFTIFFGNYAIYVTMSKPSKHQPLPRNDYCHIFSLQLEIFEIEFSPTDVIFC